MTDREAYDQMMAAHEAEFAQFQMQYQGASDMTTEMTDEDRQIAKRTRTWDCYAKEMWANQTDAMCFAHAREAGQRHVDMYKSTIECAHQVEGYAERWSAIY